MRINVSKFFIRLKTSCRKLRKRLARSRQFAVFMCLLAIFLLLFTVLSIYTPYIFNADITFETFDGAKVENTKIRRGGTISNLPQTEKEYNTFEGWYFDKEFLQPYSNSKIKKDTTLYARFETIFTPKYITNKLLLIDSIFDLDIDLTNAFYTNADEI